MKQFRISREYTVAANSELEAKQKLDEPSAHVHYLTYQGATEVKPLPKSGNVWLKDAKRQVLGE